MKQSSVIAITGFIGSGKSTVANIVRKMGYIVIDCDKLSKTVADQTETLAEITEAFGKQYVVDGVLQRKKLADYVFTSEELTNKLNEIFFEKTMDLLQKTLREVRTDKPYVFVELQVPNQKIASLFDEFWVVKTDKQNNVERVRLRDNRQSQQIEDILNKQLQNQFVFDGKTQVIFNNGTLEQLQNAVKKLL